jgi:hypothetical protein
MRHASSVEPLDNESNQYMISEQIRILQLVFLQYLFISLNSDFVAKIQIWTVNNNKKIYKLFNITMLERILA